jgi:hypothetical protein
VAVAAGGSAEARLVTRLATKGAGAAAFVQNLKTGEVLQALALPACKG